MSKAEKVVAKTIFSSLLRESKQVKEETSAIAGKFGERVQHHSEHSNLDKKAFKIVAGLVRMKNTAERDRTIQNLPLYIDLAREAGFLPEEHVGDLADMAGRGDEDGDEPDDEGDETGEEDAGDEGEEPEAGFVIGGTADDALAAMNKAARDERDPIAAHAEDEWDKADPAAKDPPEDKPKGGRRGKGMGTAEGSYKLN